MAYLSARLQWTRWMRCCQLCTEKYPECTQLGSILKIDAELLDRYLTEHEDATWLVIGGSPCQDLSERRGPHRKGLRGPKSRLFFSYVRVLQLVFGRVRTVFVFENVTIAIR